MADILNAPIPGESLTGEPRKFPWERPPEITDPKEAVDYHIDRLMEGERLKGAMLMLDSGLMSIEALTRVLMRGAVSEGLHSIDIGLVIAPVVHEFLKKTAKSTGANYREELDSEGVSSEDMDKLNTILASLEGGEEEVEDTDMPEMEIEYEEEPKEIEEVDMPRKGLMARGDK